MREMMSCDENGNELVNERGGGTSNYIGNKNANTSVTQTSESTNKKRFSTTFTKKQKIWLTIGGIIIAACFIIPITWMFMNLNNY